MRVSLLSALFHLSAAFYPAPISRSDAIISMPSIVAGGQIDFPNGQGSKNDEYIISAKKSGDDHVIRYAGRITENSCFQLAEILIACDTAAQNSTEKSMIELHITSGGGSLMPALYVCDLISSLITDVHTFADGYAASAASLLFVSGDMRFLTRHSHVLIHQLRDEQASGSKYSDMLESLQNAEMLMKDVFEIYSEHSNMDQEFLSQLLLRERWLNASACLTLGIADGIVV